MKRNNNRPQLMQEWNLKTLDFQQHPVWRCVHGVDQYETWYDECNESTFRPWDSEYPANLSEARVLLVASTFVLRNRDEYSGYIHLRRPISPNNSIKEGTPKGTILRICNSQPTLFVKQRQIAFWGGVIPIDLDSRNELYSAVGLPPKQIFPIMFATNQGLTNVCYHGRLLGFYHLNPDLGKGLGKQIITI